MRKTNNFFGKKINGTRVIPLTLKIIGIFSVFLLLSNFASNYINLILNRGELIKLQHRLMEKDLSELYGFTSNQFDIYEFTGDYEGALRTIELSAEKSLKQYYSNAFGLASDGTITFWASDSTKPKLFTDTTILNRLNENLKANILEGKIDFTLNGASYFAIYRYNPKWKAFLIRAEELGEFYANSNFIFLSISILILILTLLSIGLGIYLLRHILRFMERITNSLMLMQENQKLELIDLNDAPNDDVTYLGASFNALSSDINNLMNIFRRFVTKDVATQAYKDRQIKLEGTQKELAILFSDIKGFTYMTETLGNDIISLLNLHYDRAIRNIHANNGIVGSIIGDALLAVYGTMDQPEKKSLEAVRSAYLIQDVASILRKEMTIRKEELVKLNGALTEAEERVFQAVLIEVGVGIDGGKVFYGNIGSYERMTNTVIGDNVNSSSRLEGLTRVYHVPVICSEFIKSDIEKINSDYYFLELDTVQVKGKTEGKKIFWPIQKETITEELQQEIASFEEGLSQYYKGDWFDSVMHFRKCSFPSARVFIERMGTESSPQGWNGIWAMTTK